MSLLGVPSAKLTSSYLAGQGFFGVTFGTFVFYDGKVTAMNMTNNTIAWTHRFRSPCSAARSRPPAMSSSPAR